MVCDEQLSGERGSSKTNNQNTYENEKQQKMKMANRLKENSGEWLHASYCLITAVIGLKQKIFRKTTYL